MASSAQSVAMYFFVDLAGSVVRFPYWWYTSGFVSVVEWVRRTLVFRWRSYSFKIWLTNFFVPMYGQHDWTGRIISVVMRFFVLLAKFIAYLVEMVLYGVLLFAWLIAPVATLFLFLINVFQMV